MAIFRTGAITGAISGALGGVVFVVSSKSNVVRHRPPPRHRTSPFLARSKARMANLQKFWSELTTLQQDAWNTAARDINTTNRLGQASPMNGFQYYIMTNKTAFPGAFAEVDTPPTLQPEDTPINPSATFSVASGFDVSIDNPGAPSFLQIQVYGWPFWVDHDTNDVARFVFLDERSASSDPVVDDVRQEWIDHFGDMTLGQRFAVGLKSRGSASPFAQMAVIRGTVVA